MNLIKNSLIAIALLASTASVVAMEQPNILDTITNDFKQIEAKQALSDKRSINRGNNTLPLMTNTGQSSPVVQKALEEYKAARTTYAQALQAAPSKGRTISAEIFNAVQTKYNQLINALSSSASTSRTTTTTTAPRSTSPSTMPELATPTPIRQQPVPTTTATSSRTAEQNVLTESAPITPKKRIAKRTRREQPQSTTNSEDKKRKKQIADDEALAKQLAQEWARVEEETEEEEETPSTTTTQSNSLEEAFAVIQATEESDTIVATAVEQNNLELIKYCIENKKQDSHKQLINALIAAHANNNNEIEKYIKTVLIEKQYGTSEKICQVCMDREITPESAYTSPACGHSLCKTCMPQIQPDFVQDNATGRYHNVVRCPICRDDKFANAFTNTIQAEAREARPSHNYPIAHSSGTIDASSFNPRDNHNSTLFTERVYEQLLNYRTVTIKNLGWCNQLTINIVGDHGLQFQIEYDISRSNQLIDKEQYIFTGFEFSEDNMFHNINVIFMGLTGNMYALGQTKQLITHSSSNSSPRITFHQAGTGNQTIITPMTPAQQATFNAAMQQLSQSMNSMFRQ